MTSQSRAFLGYDIADDRYISGGEQATEVGMLVGGTVIAGVLSRFGRIFGLADEAEKVADSAGDVRFAAGKSDEFAAPVRASVHAPSSVGRKLTKADLGLEGAVSKLEGTFSIADGKAIARIDMIEGNVSNPFSIFENLKATARAQGAKTLRIEGALANEHLFEILKSRYGLQSSGGIDFIEIGL